MQNGASILFESSIVSDIIVSDVDGAAIVLMDNSTMVAKYSKFQFISPYAVHESFSNFVVVTFDSTTVLCGNDKGHVHGPYIGNPVMCGLVVISYGNTYNATIYPDMVITVNGTDLLSGDDDYIQAVKMGSVSMHVHGDVIPFTFIVPNRDQIETDSLIVVSKNGRTSETYLHYTFGYRYGECKEAGVSPPSPSRSTTFPVSFTVSDSCPFDDIKCYFGNSVVLSTSTDPGIVICTPPDWHDETTYSVVIEFGTPENRFNLTSPDLLLYYPMPSVTTVSPSVATSNLTLLNVCGVTRYAWATSPQCVMNGLYYVPAVFVSDSCLSCLYYSLAPCKIHGEHRVHVALLHQQISVAWQPVVSVCAPVVINTTIVPNKILNGTSGTTVISGGEFYQSQYLACKFGDIISAARAVDKTHVSCQIPISYDIKNVSLSVSNDLENWVYFGEFKYWAGIDACGPGFEEREDECQPCNRGYYKVCFDNSDDDDVQNSTSRDACTKCGVFMTTSDTGSISVMNCVCDRVNVTMVSNHSYCACSSGYGYYVDLVSEGCRKCEAGYDKDEIANRPCDIILDYCPLFIPPAGYRGDECANREIYAGCHLECDVGYDGLARDVVCMPNRKWTSAYGCTSMSDDDGDDNAFIKSAGELFLVILCLMTLSAGVGGAVYFMKNKELIKKKMKMMTNDEIIPLVRVILHITLTLGCW